MFGKSSFFATIFLLVAYFVYVFYNIFAGTSSVPIVPEDTWWGDSQAKNKQDDAKIYSFQIKVSDQEIKDLYLRLNLTRGFKPALENTEQWYGLNQKIMKNAVTYLKKDYNIRDRLTFVNQYPQYRTQIHGLKIHFVHVKPNVGTNVKIVPLLLLHGWPSSVREFYEMVPTLTKPQPGRNVVFEMVMASLPGFGYSDSPKQIGIDMRHVAHIYKILMKRLGHEKFYIHGSDWGAVVATTLATMFPQSALGFHSNFCTSLTPKSLAWYLIESLWPGFFVNNEYADELYSPKKFITFLAKESAYLHLMGTKPDTIGHALDNSIEALLAYTLEKFSIGSNSKNIISPSAGFERFKFETLMDTILFYYWFPRSATTSGRFYAEMLCWSGFTSSLHQVPISEDVPCACIYFENEFIYQTPASLRSKYKNLKHHQMYKSAGHFGALEQSEVLAEDIREFFTKIEEERSSKLATT